MFRFLTVSAGTMVAILLLSSDASANGRRQANCNAPTYNNSGYVCSSYGAAYGNSAPAYNTYSSPYGSYGTPYGGNAPAYGYGYGGAYDFGRPGYNPGGLGGPRSGLGVRPGLGFGGLGLRR